MEVSNKITMIEGSRDVVLTIIHNSVKKIRTKPMRIYKDEEKGIIELAKEINKETNVTVLINNTDIDLNSEGANDNEELMAEFLKIINKINPQVVIDLHGMANQGILFNNSKDSGLKVGREMVEKQIEGTRPDCDIGFRRKASSKFCTSRGETVLRLAKFLSHQGLITDIEAVFPGGNFIGNLASIDRDIMAVEIARRIRDNPMKGRAFTISIINFINSLRGQAISEEVNTAFDVEKLTEEAIKKEEKPITDYIG